MPLIGLFTLFSLSWTITALSDVRAPSFSEEAAESFGQKLKDIRDFIPQQEPYRGRSTRITEEEVNSYLSLDFDSKYQSCLRTLRLTFQQDVLESLASVDFDCVKEVSPKSLPKYISLIFSGTHVITGRGKIICDNGEGRVDLEQVLFDGKRIPNFLIKEAVKAVCEAQDLSYNPLQPSRLPYSIKRITVHPGYIMVYQ